MAKAAEYDTNSFLSRKEASRLLGVTERTITRWVNSGILQAWKTAGGHSRITVASVNAFLQKRQSQLQWRPPADTGLLVVEDDEVLLSLYLTAINSWGLPLNLVTAQDGFDGLIKVGQEQPDIIITDLKMPDMDGFQMVRSIKEKPELAGIQIIVVTSLDAEEVAEGGGLPDGVPVFHKPVPMNEIKELVAKMMAGKRHLRVV